MIPVVIEQCALKPDLALFDAGDQTEVGEKGITLRYVTSHMHDTASHLPWTLSGGQKVMQCIWPLIENLCLTTDKRHE